jgi:hypothetical protein
MSDWKLVVGSVAPALAGLLGGPLAAGVVGLVAERVLGKSSGDPVADERALANAVQAGITPEMREKLLEIQTELIRADVRKVEVAADVTKAAMTDTADARKAHAGAGWVANLAVFVNVASYLCIAGVLAGCFMVLMGRVDASKVDPGIAAMVGSLIGAAVQWLLSNAAQANGFAFGSSPTSRENAERLSKAVSESVARK